MAVGRIPGHFNFAHHVFSVAVRQHDLQAQQLLNQVAEIWSIIRTVLPALSSMRQAEEKKR